jgi:hypothetical protein
VGSVMSRNPPTSMRAVGPPISVIVSELMQAS